MGAALGVSALAGGYRFDGEGEAELAARLGVPRVVALEEVGSTLDAAHALAAEGAPAGTLVLAERQTAGRGRSGRRWSSPAGSGLWLTTIERPDDREALEVLSLRVGLEAATALDALAPARVTLKWPNDLYVRAGKLAGILVEARWREQRADWVAIGFGLNVVAPPDQPGAAGLRAGVTRLAALAAVVPALRRAAAARGSLTDAERRAFADRDLAAGRRCTSPLVGVVQGITLDGALLVETAEGPRAARGGSLIFEGEG